MRRIEKQPEPASLTAWKDQSRNDPNFGYTLLGKLVACDAIRQMVQEQHGLCAYTGIRIDANSAHIEHLKPQARSKNVPEETVTWTNMVACYPRPNFPEQVPYGAHKKKDWPQEGQDHLFVSPLHMDCESRFAFDFNGRIDPANDADAAARETIRQLGLDHGAQDVTGLTNLRAGAVRGVLRILQKPTVPLTQTQIVAKAQRMLQAMETPADGKLPEFCFVKKQVIRRFIQNLIPGRHL